MTERLTVRIRASAALGQPAPEEPQRLRDELKTLCPQAPRRLNRFTELALLGAVSCARRAANDLPSDCRVFLGTGRGYADDTARLVASVVMRGEPPMPVDFINVSGSATNFYLAKVLGLRGGSSAVAAGSASFEAALDLAWTALAVAPGLALVGAVDDVAYPLSAYRTRLGLAPEAAVAQVSSWLLLDSRADAPGPTLSAPLFYYDFEDLLAALDARPAAQLSLGAGMAPKERARLARRGPLREPSIGWADTAAGFAVAAWLESGSGTRLVHVAGAGDGYYLVDLAR